MASDAIVVGVGGMGSAACWHLARRGRRVQAHRRLKGRPQAEADAFRDRPPGRSSGRSVPLLRADSAAAAAGL